MSSFCFLSLIHIFLSRANTGMLSLTPLKCVVLGVRDPQPDPRLLPPYAEPLAEQAQSGQVVATEVIESAAPAPALDAGNLAEGAGGPEAIIIPAVIEPLVEATAGDGDTARAGEDRASAANGRQTRGRGADGGGSFSVCIIIGGRGHGGGADSRRRGYPPSGNH